MLCTHLRDNVRVLPSECARPAKWRYRRQGINQIPRKLHISLSYLSNHRLPRPHHRVYSGGFPISNAHIPPARVPFRDNTRDLAGCPRGHQNCRIWNAFPTWWPADNRADDKLRWPRWCPSLCHRLYPIYPDNIPVKKRNNREMYNRDCLKSSPNWRHDTYTYT